MQKPKVIYLANRRPDYTPQEFTVRWRQHAALGMSQPRWINVERYLHCDPLAGLPPEVMTADSDGVAIVLFRSETHRQHHIAQEASRMTMKADELQTFQQPVAHTSLLAHEALVKPGPEGPYKLFLFWQANGDDDGDGADFLSAWQAHGQDWLARLSNSNNIRFVQNIPVHPRTLQTIGLPCDGIDELSAVNPNNLQALAQQWIDHQLPATLRMLLTRTVVLHDQP
jgi:hypothetical protein